MAEVVETVAVVEAGLGLAVVEVVVPGIVAAAVERRTYWQNWTHCWFDSVPDMSL